MLYRNLLAMETEELLRSYPVDGAVLMGGCDKTTPALLMGAASAGIPAIFVPAGPMLRGNYRGTAARQRHRPVEVLGRLPGRADRRLRAGRARVRHRPLAGALHDHGHRLHDDRPRAEALGMTLPGAASIPAVDSAHYRMAAASGHADRARWRREDLDPRTGPDPRGLRGRGGHGARARRLDQRPDPPDRDGRARAGSRCTLDDFDAIARRVPVLANIRPSGKYLMEDFYYAGGLRALLAPARSRCPARCTRPADGRRRPRSASSCADATVHDEDVIRSPEHALSAEGGVAVLRGNLAPDGAVIKHIAAEPRLLKHTGPAVVFDSYAEMQARIDDPALRHHPRLGAGAAQRRAARAARACRSTGCCRSRSTCSPQGVTDMVRISDARMSGTSYGACVLHVAPEVATSAARWRWSAPAT